MEHIKILKVQSVKPPNRGARRGVSIPSIVVFIATLRRGGDISPIQGSFFGGVFPGRCPAFTWRAYSLNRHVENVAGARPDAVCRFRGLKALNVITWGEAPGRSNLAHPSFRSAL